MPKQGLVISSFNAATFAAYLTNEQQAPRVTCSAAPFGQVESVLLDATLPCWNQQLDFAVVWTLPEQVLPSFAALLKGEKLDLNALHEEVDGFANAVLGAKGRTGLIFVPTWVVPPYRAGRGMLDLNPSYGISRGLMHANLRLMERLDSAAGIVLLNADGWVNTLGEKAFNFRLWYSAKVPFSNDLLKVAAQEFKAALRGLGGLSRKLIVVDLDDTLWGGIVGDVGWENLVLGGHDPAGEAFVHFQRELKFLARRGVVLAIASKNEERTALDAIDKHPEMVLRRDDFAGWRINWSDKAANIAALVSDLNLGLDSVVFLDDNPVERARVREQLPGVLVPDLPVDKRLYVQTLRQLACFDRAAISTEDESRQSLYLQERRRKEAKLVAGSLDDWLLTLGTKLRVEAINSVNIARVVQLLNKTNQMNLSTRRLSDQQLCGWLASGERAGFALHVSDRFGDAGLTGILTVEKSGTTVRIVDFVLSCRVMGRRIEEGMLHVAERWARNNGARTVVAKYVGTAKNQPCLNFFQQSKWNLEGDETFAWQTLEQYDLPASVTVDLTSAGSGFESSILRDYQTTELNPA